MPITEIASILETVISDIPTLVQIVEKLITIFKENRAPTDEEWQEMNALCDAASAKLQAD